MPRPFAAAAFLGALLPLVLSAGPGGSAPHGLTEGGVVEAAAPKAPAASGARIDPTLRPLRWVSPDRPRDARPAFLATVDGAPVRLSLSLLSLLPGDGVAVHLPAVDTPVAFRAQAGAVRELGPGRWRWTAPEAPGIYALRVDGAGGALHWTVLVAHPADRVRNDALLGYRIGRYRAEPLRGDGGYLPPEGFAAVAAADRDILASPGFTLGQFLCKQPGEPRLLVLSPDLLVKLEAVADRMRAVGWDPSALVVMSGYRTPAYNRAIGNTTSYSRHLWGDAADLYLDADGDGQMDDLDGNGRVDLADARVLAGWVEDAVGEAGVEPGGLALYRRNAVRGPFVHVDARGTRARW